MRHERPTYVAEMQDRDDEAEARAADESLFPTDSLVPTSSLSPTQPLFPTKSRVHHSCNSCCAQQQAFEREKRDQASIRKERSETKQAFAKERSETKQAFAKGGSETMRVSHSAHL